MDAALVFKTAVCTLTAYLEGNLLYTTKASFTKAPSAPLKRVGKCRSAAALWTHLVTATLKPLLQGKECSEGLGAVHDTRTQEIGWGRYPKENCNRFEFSDANIKRET